MKVNEYLNLVRYNCPRAEFGAYLVSPDCVKVAQSDGRYYATSFQV